MRQNVITRTGKGSPLTVQEIDDNFTLLNNLFIGPNPPVNPPIPYMWVQTFPNGDLTVWVDDGS